jgi:hypothetical protein
MVKWFSSLLLWLLISVPWGASLYAHFLLSADQLWSVEQPYRQLTSVFILATGMFASFALYCVLFRASGRR